MRSSIIRITGSAPISPPGLDIIHNVTINVFTIIKEKFAIVIHQYAAKKANVNPNTDSKLVKFLYFIFSVIQKTT